MKRALIIGIVLLLAVIVGIGVFLYNSIDSIVEAAIEKHGSRVLGTQVSVGSVDISLKSGRGTIRDIEVANPDGFSSGEMFTLREATVDINVKSLNRDPITIDEIRISAPDVRVEMNERGGSNVAAVKKAVEAYQSGSAPKDRKQDSGFEKRFRIEKLEEERTALGADIREVYSEAKGSGFDVKIMRQVVRLRKLEPAERAEMEELLDIYRQAIGMA